MLATTGPRRPRIVRQAAAAAVAAGVVLVGAGCTVSGSGSAPPQEVAAYKSEVTESIKTSKQNAESAAKLTLCLRLPTIAGDMLGSYNAMIDKLNKSQNFDAIAPDATKAHDALVNGANEIRQGLKGASTTMTQALQPFLSATDKLAGVIVMRNSDQLNAVADRWSAEKKKLLGICMDNLGDSSTAPTS